jgi:hypothetical protein
MAYISGGYPICVKSFCRAADGWAEAAENGSNAEPAENAEKPLWSCGPCGLRVETVSASSAFSAPRPALVSATHDVRHRAIRAHRGHAATAIVAAIEALSTSPVCRSVKIKGRLTVQQGPGLVPDLLHEVTGG